MENLKQALADVEEKVQYQSEERVRDIHEMLELCQTKVIFDNNLLQIDYIKKFCIYIFILLFRSVKWSIKLCSSNNTSTWKE